MDLSTWQKMQAKARRQTMFGKKGLISAQSETKRSICNVHLILAKEIAESKLKNAEKVKMLLLIDEAYNLGKRMAAKLDFYGEGPTHT